MGLFDDDDFDSYTPNAGKRPEFKPTPERREQERPGRKESFRREFFGRKREREEGISAGTVIRHELGLGSWTGKHVLALLLVIVVIIGVFVLKFGTNPAEIGAQIKDRLGLAPGNMAAQVVSSGDIHHLRVKVNGKVQTVQLLGVHTRCNQQANQRLRRALRPGSMVGMQYDSTLPHTVGNKQLAYLTLKDHTESINVALVQLGLATPSNIGRADQADAFRTAEKDARDNHRGLWAGCR